MTGLLAFVCYVVATVIFALLALEVEDGPEAAWGFMFIALGLAVASITAAHAEARRRSAGN